MGPFVPGAEISFAHSSHRGAVLMLKDGFAKRLNAVALGFLETYTIQNYREWLRFTNVRHGRGIKLSDLMVVTGCDRTGAWALAAFSAGGREGGFSFKVDTPFGGARGGAWGRWSTAGSTRHNCGPCDQNPPAVDQSMDDGTVDAYSSSNQSVFIRGLHVYERFGIPKIRAGAGPHVLQHPPEDDDAGDESLAMDILENEDLSREEPVSSRVSRESSAHR